MLEAILFDCDGVLLDSEAIYLGSVVDYLKSIGRTASIDDIAYTVGTDIYNITQKLQKQFSLYDHDIDEMIKGQRRIFHERFYTGELTPMEGLRDFLKLLREAGLKTAVVSSSGQDYVNYVLKALGIENQFDLAMGKTGDIPAKPDPALYLMALKNLGLTPKEALVIEDSVNGIKAGHGAGCKVIGYAGSELVKQDISKADIQVKSFSELNLDILWNLA